MPAEREYVDGVLGGQFSTTLCGAKTGSPDAFARIWRDLQPAILRYLRVFAADDVEDVASETWIHVVKGLDKFDGCEAAFRAWVFTIARRTAVDQARVRARRLERSSEEMGDELVIDITDHESKTESEVLEHLSTDAALRLIATLPHEQAEIVTLRVIAGLDAAQVARMLGMTPGAVRIAAYRALHQLARTLEAEPGVLVGETS